MEVRVRLTRIRLRSLWLTPRLSLRTALANPAPIQIVSRSPFQSGVIADISAIGPRRCQIGVAYTAAYVGHHAIRRLGIVGRGVPLILTIARASA
jgi:hypothetical protein